MDPDDEGFLNWRHSIVSVNISSVENQTSPANQITSLAMQALAEQIAGDVNDEQISSLSMEWTLKINGF